MSEPNHADLLRDHAVIERLAGQLGTMLDRKAEAADLSRTLRMLVETVHGHLEEEDAMIYALALREEGMTEAEVAALRASFERLKCDWQEYLALWTPEQIAAGRAEFETATRAMLPRLRDRVQLETELLCLMNTRHRGSPTAH